jgi:hypothetical protein
MNAVSSEVITKSFSSSSLYSPLRENSAFVKDVTDFFYRISD